MGYVRLVSCYMPSYLPCCVLPSTHLVLMLFGTPILTSLYNFFEMFFILVSVIFWRAASNKHECNNKVIHTRLVMIRLGNRPHRHTFTRVVTHLWHQTSFKGYTSQHGSCWLLHNRIQNGWAQWHGGEAVTGCRETVYIVVVNVRHTHTHTHTFSASTNCLLLAVVCHPRPCFCMDRLQERWTLNRM